MQDHFTNERILECLRGSEVGGGEGHRSDVTAADADVVATSRSELLDHIGSRGTVVWIPGHERIDLSGWSGTVRATVASERGVDGLPGALLYTTDHGSSSQAWDGGSGRGVMQMAGGSRLTGVRYRGPYHDHYDDPRYPGYIPLDSGSASERRRKRQARYARGINVVSGDVEIDNCEIYGWPVQAINVGSASSSHSPYIHHVYGHDCMMAGAGYVVDIIRGHPRIEYCYFDATRHAICGFGHEDCGFTVEDSVFGPSTLSHAVDMHCLSENGYSGDLTAGGRIDVRRCTFAFTHNINGRWAQAIAFRGYPAHGYVTENNRFLHSADGDGTIENVANSSYEPVPYRQVNVGSGWHDWEFSDNQYGAGEAKRSHVGAPVDLDDPYDGRPLIGEDRRRGLLHGIESLQ
ncbi:hypothetical protein [Halalkalicoccus ordinarius]|uniref:hypothetical protein n=1 Tax=Halalkalicoccus ordinarius TaxID=3116651 RepID=UPI00300F091B